MIEMVFVCRPNRRNDSPDQIWIHAGVSHIDEYAERRNVSEVHRHPKYIRHAWPDYDIALLRLERILPWSKTIQKIGLLSIKAVLDSEEHCHVIGFGLSKKRIV